MAIEETKEPVSPPIPNSNKIQYTGKRRGNQPAMMEITSPKSYPRDFQPSAMM